MTMTPEEAVRRVLVGIGNEPIIPHISINGSGQMILLAGYIVAIERLRLALNALGETAPHGRDYATTDILTMAIEAHRRRQRAIEQVMAELTQIAEAIGG